MTDKQPDALRLADALDELDAQFSFRGLCGEAAAELRRLHGAREECERQYQEKVEEIIRLHEVNAELVEALRVVIRGVPDTWDGVRQAKAVLAKAQGEKND